MYLYYLVVGGVPLFHVRVSSQGRLYSLPPENKSRILQRQIASDGRERRTIGFDLAGTIVSV
jgi:hypothetical protein